MVVIGVDVAHEGSDHSVAIVRRDYQVLEIVDWAKADIPQSADRVERLFRRYEAEDIIVDCDGLGVGVRDLLRQRGIPVTAFHGQARTDRKDESGELGFANMRSLAWWNLRQILDPHKGFNLILPKDDGLLGDLCCPRWDVINQRITVEAKDQIKRRLKRSTDKGDALAYAFCPIDPSTFEENYRVYAAAEVDQIIQRGDPRPIRTEEDQIDSMMWINAHQNHDLTADY